MHLDKLSPENWMYGMRWKEIKYHKGEVFSIDSRMLPLVGGSEISSFPGGSNIKTIIKARKTADISDYTQMQVIWTCTFLGGALATWYFFRLCFRAPDVSWRHGANPQPWEKMPQNVQYKFYSPHIDFKKRGLYPDAGRPDIDLRPY